MGGCSGRWTCAGDAPAPTPWETTIMDLSLRRLCALPANVLRLGLAAHSGEHCAPSHYPQSLLVRQSRRAFVCCCEPCLVPVAFHAPDLCGACARHRADGMILRA